MDKFLTKKGEEKYPIQSISIITIPTTNQLIPMTSTITPTSDIVDWSYTNNTDRNQRINFTLRGEIQRKLHNGSGQLLYSDGIELYGISGFSSQMIHNGRENLTENGSYISSVSGINDTRARTCSVGMIGIVAPGATVTIQARAYGQHTFGLDTTSPNDHTTFFCDSFAEITTL